MRTLLIIFLALFLSACTTTRIISRDELAADPPHSIHLFMNDGRMIALENFLVADETLIGFGKEHRSQDVAPFAGSVSLRDVQRMETANDQSTPLYVLAGAPAAVVLVYLLLQGASSPPIIIR